MRTQYFIYLFLVGLLISCFLCFPEVAAPNIGINISRNSSKHQSFDLLGSTEARSRTDLRITHPNGGEILSGNATIRWVLPNEYIDFSVQYCVYYSPDSGAHWIQIAFYITSPSFIWNTPLYETYGTNFLIKVVATCKNWSDKEDISDSPFIIDNREGDNSSKKEDGINLFENPLVQLLGTVLIFVSVVGGGFSYIVYRDKSKQESVMELLQSNKIEFLTAIRHKVIIGLDNINADFIAESQKIPRFDAEPIPVSIVEYFPSDIREDLQHNIKGRTVLTLIEIAYLDPSETNPAKLARSLNIPPSTLSKEIKKLIDLQYVKTYVSAQVLQDARYRNFTITPKGFTFLSLLDNSLRIAIDRLKRK
ncbi:MAG: hypothetical protein ACFFBD_02615 [Candidatus Hodarchaeota archaeon]